MANKLILSKRYTLLNTHIRGSNAMPQGFHGLNRLWMNRPEMSAEANALFDHWLTTSETEVVLHGGGQKALEDLYARLVQIPSVPAGKFNESDDDLKGCCTVVTFVGSENVVAGGIVLRGNHIAPFQAVQYLTDNTIDVNGVSVQLTADEIFLATSVAYLPTFGG